MRPYIYIYIPAVSEGAELKNRKRSETNMNSNRMNERYLVLVFVLHLGGKNISNVISPRKIYIYIYI